MIIAATGHRPNKLGGYGSDVKERLFVLACYYLKHSRPSYTVSGMALGWDMAWAKASIECRVPFIAAVPFAGQESQWPHELQHEYHKILKHAFNVTIVCPGGYAPWKMQKRNEWMVEGADRIAALWDGSRGGTSNCVNYAIRRGKPIDNLWKNWIDTR